MLAGDEVLLWLLRSNVAAAELSFHFGREKQSLGLLPGLTSHVLELESVWGWQIGSVSFPPLLSSEELFSINYGCIIFFFPEVSWLCGGSEV